MSTDAIVPAVQHCNIASLQHPMSPLGSKAPAAAQDLHAACGGAEGGQPQHQTPLFSCTKTECCKDKDALKQSCKISISGLERC